MESTPVGSDQVIDPHQLGYFTDSLTGNKGLHLDAGVPSGARQHTDIEAVQGQSRDGMAHHPSIRLARRLAELECRPILEIARLSVMEFLLEHTTQHQHQSLLCLQFVSRNTGSARNV